MGVIQQVSLFSENKPGKLAKILKVLAGAGVNIRSFNIANAGDFGVLRFIVSDPARAEKAFKKAGFVAARNDVLAVVMEDRAGELYRITGLLAKGGVNVDNAYAFVSSPGRSAVLILELKAVKKAASVLKKAGVKLTSAVPL